MNPLFANDDHSQQPKPDPGYVLPRGQNRTVKPLTDAEKQTGRYTKHDDNNAANLIRQKLDILYDEEPDAKSELSEIKDEAPSQRSKHAQYMLELNSSGKPLAEIQTAWHTYYISLPDNEKHEVWREFYDANSRQPSPYMKYAHTQGALKDDTHHNEATPHAATAHQAAQGTHQAVVSDHTPAATDTGNGSKRRRKDNRRNLVEFKQQVAKKVQMSAAAQAKARQHFHSLLFGLGFGALVLLIFLFSFFNEVIITPFIQPKNHVSATPIILSTNGVAPSETPEVIIPKINVEIPVNYSNTSIDEETIQDTLEDGTVHYPTTVRPGELGNTAIFGHSSNNIFNKGQYKFAFVLLHKLVPGDIFYLTYNKKVYSYKVFDKRIVEPNDVSVLNPVEGKAATATLITCDPPGTSLHRLVVWGEQVSPDPGSNTAATTSQDATLNTAPTALPSNGPTLWSRLWNSIF